MAVVGPAVLWAATPVFYGALIGPVQLWVVRSGLARDRQVILVLMAIVGGAAAGMVALGLWVFGRQFGLFRWPLPAVVFAGMAGGMAGAIGGVLSGLLQQMFSGPRWLSWRWIAWNTLTWSLTWGLAWLGASLLEGTPLWFLGEPVATGFMLTALGVSLALFARLTHQAEM